MRSTAYRMVHCPLHCPAQLCACDGGAEHLGCAPVWQCTETGIRCPLDCRAELSDDGCPAWVCMGG